MMGKKKQLAKIAHKAIEDYMALIAQVDALANPLVKSMLETEKLMKEALDMSIHVDEIMVGDE